LSKFRYEILKTSKEANNLPEIGKLSVEEPNYWQTKEEIFFAACIVWSSSAPKLYEVVAKPTFL
jgi:hypothetical protein